MGESVKSDKTSKLVKFWNGVKTEFKKITWPDREDHAHRGPYEAVGCGCRYLRHCRTDHHGAGFRYAVWCGFHNNA